MAASGPDTRDLTRSMLVVLFILGLTAGCLLILRPFLTALVGATTIAISTWPMLKGLERRWGGRRGLAIAGMMVLLAIAILARSISGRSPRCRARAPCRSGRATCPTERCRRRRTGSSASRSWARGSRGVGELATGGGEGIKARLSAHTGEILGWLMGRLGNLAGMLVEVLVTLGLTGFLYARGEKVAAVLLRFAPASRREPRRAGRPPGALATRGVGLGVVLTPLIQSILAGIGMAVAGVPVSGCSPWPCCCPVSPRSGRSPRSLSPWPGSTRTARCSRRAGCWRGPSWSTSRARSSAPSSSSGASTCPWCSSSPASSAGGGLRGGGSLHRPGAARGGHLAARKLDGRRRGRRAGLTSTAAGLKAHGGPMVRMRPTLLAAVLLPAAASADEVFLKGGGQLSGRIVTRTATTVEVDVGAGRIGVPASSVLRIEEGRSPLHEYEERAGRLAAADVAAGSPWPSGRRLEASDAGARGLPPRAGRVARRPARERGPRERADRRPVGERGRELPGAGLRAVRRGVDHSGRARGDPARARRRGRPGPGAPGGRVACARAEARAEEAEARPGRRGPAVERGNPAVVRLGRRPAYWPTGRSSDPPSPRPAGRTAEAGAEVSAVNARLVLAALALIVSPSVAAQTLDEIVARHVAARGGREALAAVRTLRMTGRATGRPRPAGDRAARDRPSWPYPHEFVFQGTTGVYAWDGTAGWRVSPLDGRLEPSSCRPRRPSWPPSRRTSRARSLTGKPRATGSSSSGQRRWPAAPHTPEGHPEVGRRAARLGRRRDRPRRADGGDANGAPTRGGHRDDLRGLPRDRWRHLRTLDRDERTGKAPAVADRRRERGA